MNETIGQQEWLDIFGDNLASILEEESISQKELSRLTGLSESTISRYINKLQMPTVRAIINISFALDWSFEDMLNYGAMLEEI